MFVDHLDKEGVVMAGEEPPAQECENAGLLGPFWVETPELIHIHILQR
eukprot:gene8443-17792_t